MLQYDNTARNAFFPHISLEERIQVPKPPLYKCLGDVYHMSIPKDLRQSLHIVANTATRRNVILVVQDRFRTDTLEKKRG